jgi:hypothetical protein
MPNARDLITVKELAEGVANLKSKAVELARALECVENLFLKHLELPDPIRIRRDPEGGSPPVCFGVCKVRERRR